jgi:hypothetical protein
MPAEDAIAAIIEQLADARRRIANLERLETSSYTAHDPVTLDANSVQVNSLTGQELGLQVQAHNFAWIGPESGAPAIPTFRLLVTGDIPIDSDTYNAAATAVLGTDADGGARLDHLDVGSAAGAGEGDVSYSANLHPTRGGTEYTGYVYVPCIGRVTALSWSARNADTYSVDTSALGLPTIKAAVVLLSIQWAAAGDSIYAGWRHPDYTDLYGLVRSYVAGSLHDHVSVVPCNSNGDFNLYITGANATGSEAYILGYFI